MHRRRLLAGSALLCAFLLAAPGAGRAEEETTDDVVEIVTTDSLPLEDFLKAVGRHARVTFLWDPGAEELARARFATARNLTATRDGLFALIRSVLASYDLALVPIGPAGGHPIYRVMAVRDLGGAAVAQPKVITLDRDNLETHRTQHGLLVTTTLRTRYLRDLKSVRSALLAHATRDGVGRVEVLPELPGFAVTDFAPAVVSIRDALEQIDQPAPQPRHPVRLTKRIDLEHADAEETAAGLAAHLGANLALPAPQALSPTMRAAPVLGLRILADERTNTLLVSGAPERVGEVQEAVALLDVPVVVPSSWIHVVRLKHLQAVPTARTLRELAATSAVLRAGDDAPPTTIVADSQTNAILVEAAPRVFEQLKALLEALDQDEPNDDEG